jgi:hypothetical protein
MGILCLVNVGTMITNRSNHIPRTIEIEAMTVPGMVRNFLMARMGKGMTKHKVKWIQKRGANFPDILDQKMAI